MKVLISSIWFLSYQKLQKIFHSQARIPSPPQNIHKWSGRQIGLYRIIIHLHMCEHWVETMRHHQLQDIRMAKTSLQINQNKHHLYQQMSLRLSYQILWERRGKGINLLTIHLFWCLRHCSIALHLCWRKLCVVLGICVCEGKGRVCRCSAHVENVRG